MYASSNEYPWASPEKPNLSATRLCTLKGLKSLFFSFLFQEQYQFLYKAMLSLVSTKENGNGPMTLDKNGAVMASDESDPAESMESLV